MMTRKVISFLGYTPPDRPYRPTTYVYQEKEHYTPFMSEAAAHFFSPDHLLVLVTSDAKVQNFGYLEKNLHGVITPKPVDIPSGKHEQELWEIFDAIASCIEKGDTIIFDITNGFRSLPVLAFLAASYVRLVRDATVEQMVYGAFDEKDEKSNRTPVFDLTPFLTLLDWTTATNTFIKSGRATDLSALLRSGISSSGGEFNLLANRLETLSLALHTSRPATVMQSANGLSTDITGVKPHIAGGAIPFGLLLDKINAEYSIFGLDEPMEQKNARHVLERLRKVIDWYIDKDLLIQAMTLSREWLVSLVVYHLNGDIFDDSRGGDRKKAETVINNYKNNRTAPNPTLEKTLPDILTIWSEVDPDSLQARDLRNDLAHCGMRKNAREPEEVVQGVRSVRQKLHQLLPS
jgi:CRISPR-associated DxTHG motif protein